ncbi:hypothetical protein QFC22_001509 [Naganishia vaughanmartiniae]|uniref:Uncharacterized protein n=1 Tax=Naganishia vaughanmartiniae TaxID=1424756 RepID=A0ACC2XH10_9TREE|nr:hypothetical protein QFC22_001509 [Naganishia vaughanmartiniae]
MSAPSDQETAPLLDPTSGAVPAHSDSHHRSFLSGPSRGLTLLEKILAALAILFLLLAATFIGLFVGTNHQLGKERHRGPVTVTASPTGGHGVTSTVIATSTVGKQRPFPGPTGKPGHGHHDHQETCLTKECVLLASNILTSLDESVDPCQDFYSFANGGWLKSHSLPADRGVYGTFTELQDENRKVILSILEGKDDGKAASDGSEEERAERANLKKLRTGYAACMDVDRINAQGTDPILPLIDEIKDILGPFFLPTHPSFAAVGFAAQDPKDDDWEGTYTPAYRVPEEFKVHAELVEEARKRSARAPMRSASTEMRVEKRSDAPNDVGKRDTEALTRALAFAHSRTMEVRRKQSADEYLGHATLFVGVDALLGFAIEGDAGGEDPQIQELFMYQTSGGLPSKEYYEEKPILDFYTSVVAELLAALAQPTPSKKHADDSDDLEAESWWPIGHKGGKSKSGKKIDKKKFVKQIKALSKDVVRFERELMRAGADIEDLFNPTFSYNPYPFNNLSKELSFMDLPAYISTFNTRNFPTKVVVTHPPYIHSVQKILSRTPHHVLSAYFVTRFGLSYSTLLGPQTPVRLATRRLQELLQGLKPGTPEDRQMFCQAYVDSQSGLGFLGGKEFVDRKFAGDSKEKAAKVIYDIIGAFKARLPSVPWMDKESAKAAQGKAETMLVKVGYPTSPNVSSAVALERYFAPLTIDRDFFANGLRTRVLAETRDWYRLGKQRDRGEWEMVPQLVNAYYSPPDGEIVFPAGILQPPFFSAAWPDYLNYGAFGSVAAHELSHAFDNTGAQYDEHGRLRDWWTNSTVKAFKEKAQCLARQYSKYTIDGPDGKPVHVNGNLTNGEDLGDSGITFSWSAWKNLTTSEQNLKLPGIKYTEEQLFFISSSRVWAQLIKPEAALARIRTDPHSPNQFRSNGQLSGFKKFAEVFNCPAGSPMNPKQRCDVW